MLRYRVTGNNLCTRWGCGVCGQEFTLDAVVMTEIDESGKQIHGSELCEDCIKGGPDVIRKHLSYRAADLRERAVTIVAEMMDAAAALERDAAGEIHLPPWGEYQRMYNKWLEYRREDSKEYPEELNRRQW